MKLFTATIIVLLAAVVMSICGFFGAYRQISPQLDEAMFIVSIITVAIGALMAVVGVVRK